MSIILSSGDSEEEPIIDPFDPIDSSEEKEVSCYFNMYVLFIQIIFKISVNQNSIFQNICLDFTVIKIYVLRHFFSVGSHLSHTVIL